MKDHPDAWRRRSSPIGGTTPRDFAGNPQRRLRRWLERRVIASGAASLLDVACNAGIEGWRLREAGWRGFYIGADTNEKALAAAREVLAGRGPFALVRADARRLPFRDGACDAVLVKDLLEHLEDHRPALDGAARAARRVLLIGLFIPLGRSQRLVRHPDGYWLNRWARGPFLARLAGLGFAVLRIRTIWRLWAREQVVEARREVDRPAGEGEIRRSAPP